MTDAPHRVGDVNQDALTLLRIAGLLDQKYPEIVTETSSDGKRNIPLREAAKFDERMKREVEEAFQRGHKDGHAQGRAEGREEAQKVFSAFGKAVQDCVGQRETLLREAELHITDMILKIARKLTFDTARLDPEITAGIVKGAIDTLIDKRNISVRVHPDHLPVLEQSIDEFKSMSTEIRDLQIEADPRVGFGGCFIRTPAGDIDARLESQFEIIEDTLRDESV